jgi:hypothetical protein
MISATLELCELEAVRLVESLGAVAFRSALPLAWLSPCESTPDNRTQATAPTTTKAAALPTTTQVVLDFAPAETVGCLAGTAGLDGAGDIGGAAIKGGAATAPGAWGTTIT